MATTTYTSNNSGGDWWLSDEDWFALEAAGWDVKWIAGDEFYQRYGDTDRWLGALAKEATRDLPEAMAIAEWEHVTGKRADDEGCPCCGAPHYFSEDN